jgi:hypothetical protein
MLNILKDNLSNAVPHFRDAIGSLFFTTVTSAWPIT